MAIFKPSRVIAVVLVLGAAGWIASGALAPREDASATAGDAAGTTTAPAEPTAPVQKVSVAEAVPTPHERKIVLSCTTKADHSSIAVARAAGIITSLKISRGSPVKAGDVIAELSDEGREAGVKQAEAMLLQRKAEYDANKALIDKGNAPKNNLPALEASVAAAEAALSLAKADAERSIIRAPISGLVDTVPVQVGQAVQAGTQIAEIINPDPMLAVGAVSERQRGALQLDQNATVRFIDGAPVNATVSFVSLSADAATRTYSVEARMVNPDAAIADGVTCEMTVTLKPIVATDVPRSALVFSDDGRLGVRVADKDSMARCLPITVIDDGVQSVWVTGIDEPTRVIVVGQDFVKDGDKVEAVVAADARPAAAGPPA